MHAPSAGNVSSAAKMKRRRQEKFIAAGLTADLDPVPGIAAIEDDLQLEVRHWRARVFGMRLSRTTVLPPRSFDGRRQCSRPWRPRYAHSRGDTLSLPASAAATTCVVIVAQEARRIAAREANRERLERQTEEDARRVTMADVPVRRGRRRRRRATRCPACRCVVVALTACGACVCDVARPPTLPATVLPADALAARI
jgi:hypothetical protein